MEALLIVVACALLSCPVKGNDWWEEFYEGIRYYSDEDLNKTFPDKTRPKSFQHPPFKCPDMTPSPTVPSSVELVKAADIKVIAALGDSLTSAYNANGTTWLEIAVEYRLVSFSIGGYGTFQDVITLPNIIKLFNPNLLGASTGKTMYGVQATFSETGFNLAVTKANSYKLPSQTRKLIDAMKKHEGLDFDKDWKLLTILIGMNDVCHYCNDKALHSVNNFIKFMTVSLEMLMNEVPRMIVNVVQIIPMNFLKEVQNPDPGCSLAQSFCPCLIEPLANSRELKEVVKVNLEFQKRLENLLYSNRFFKKDFAVVLQPFLKQANPPRLPNGKIDVDFFSPDCFHITIKGHEEMAKALWNNMFQPGGQKTMVKSFSEPVKLICPPKKHPYIYTRPFVPRSSSSLLRSKSTSLAGVVLLLLLFVA